MPSIPRGQVVFANSIEVRIDENINAPFVVFQTAVLHTSSEGERRIRIITLTLPTTSNLSELYLSADQIAIATFLSSEVVERSISEKFEDSRDVVTNKMVNIFYLQSVHL